MGNIRPSFIKIRALRLVEIYPDKFTADFELTSILSLSSQTSTTIGCVTGSLVTLHVTNNAALIDSACS